MAIDTVTVAPHRAPAMDYDNVLLLPDMALLFKTSRATILRRLQDGTFPIRPLPSHGIDQKIRWWGPTVRAWFERHGGQQ